MRQSERIERFVEEIWQWYARNKRALPWRDLRVADDTERAYRILVSEIMLQQTQVSRVIVLYKRFLRRFPTIRHLAGASNRDVILAWRGMGYNVRALRLRDAARAIVSGYWLAGYWKQRQKAKNEKVSNQQLETGQRVTKVSFPREFDELIAIPGIGPYTAAAIRNFAFGIPTPCLDTNIRRILHRTFVGPEHPDGMWRKDDAYLLKIAKEVLGVALDSVAGYSLAGCRKKTRNQKPASQQPRRTTADWHSALMDFGSLVQTKIHPKWHLCPLTATGIMKTTKKSWGRGRTALCHPERNRRTRSSEPGRMVGASFVPNRIFRGRIVEALRVARRGLPLDRLGRQICLDWADEQIPWLRGLITKLIQEELLAERGGTFVLRE